MVRPVLPALFRKAQKPGALPNKKQVPHRSFGPVRNDKVFGNKVFGIAAAKQATTPSANSLLEYRFSAKIDFHRYESVAAV